MSISMYFSLLLALIISVSKCTDFCFFHYSARNVYLNSAVNHLQCMSLWQIVIVEHYHEIEVKAKHI